MIMRLEKEVCVCRVVTEFWFFHSATFVSNRVCVCVCVCNCVNSDLLLGLADTAPPVCAYHRASLLNAQMSLFLFSGQSCEDKEPTEIYGSTVT